MNNIKMKKSLMQYTAALMILLSLMLLCSVNVYSENIVQCRNCHDKSSILTINNASVNGIYYISDRLLQLEYDYSDRNSFFVYVYNGNNKEYLVKQVGSVDVLDISASDNALLIGYYASGQKSYLFINSQLKAYPLQAKGRWSIYDNMSAISIDKINGTYTISTSGEEITLDIPIANAGNLSIYRSCVIAQNGDIIKAYEVKNKMFYSIKAPDIDMNNRNHSIIYINSDYVIWYDIAKRVLYRCNKDGTTVTKNVLPVKPDSIYQTRPTILCALNCAYIMYANQIVSIDKDMNILESHKYAYDVIYSCIANGSLYARTLGGQYINLNNTFEERYIATANNRFAKYEISASGYIVSGPTTRTYSVFRIINGNDGDIRNIIVGKPIRAWCVYGDKIYFIDESQEIISCLSIDDGSIANEYTIKRNGLNSVKDIYVSAKYIVCVYNTGTSLCYIDEYDAFGNAISEHTINGEYRRIMPINDGFAVIGRGVIMYIGANPGVMKIEDMEDVIDVRNATDEVIYKDANDCIRMFSKGKSSIVMDNIRGDILASYRSNEKNIFIYNNVREDAQIDVYSINGFKMVKICALYYSNMYLYTDGITANESYMGVMYFMGTPDYHIAYHLYP